MRSSGPGDLRNDGGGAQIPAHELRVPIDHAGGARSNFVRVAIEAYRLEAREPAGVRLGGGGDAV